jgi:hypothetical protein
MNKELIGLNTYLYTFPLHCTNTFNLAINTLAKKGTVTIVYIDNLLGLELKLFKTI